MQSPPGNTSSRNAVLVVATLSSFLTPFMGAAVNIALPTIGEELAMGAVALGWVATSYLLASAVFLVPMGRLADLHGRKKVFTCGIVLFAVSSLLTALAWSAPVLIAFRALQGMSSGMIFGTSVAILTSAYPPRERGRVLGINAAAVYLGLSAGPFLGGVLTEYLGWRSIFWINVPLAAVIIVLVLTRLKGEWAEARGEAFDLPGTVIYGFALIAVIYGFSLLPALTAAWVILAGVVALIVFIRWESRAASPVLNIGLFRHNTIFALSNVAALINYCATFSVSFLLSLYLQYIKGLTPEAAGVILVAMPGVQALFSPSAGRLSDRVEPRVVSSAGMALSALGLVLLTFVDTGTSIGYIVGCLAVLGLGFALFASPNTNAIMGSVPVKAYGVASGTLATMRTIGMMLSLGIAMLIFAVYIGHAQITPEYYPAFVRSLKTAFVVSAALCFGGTFASLARGRLHGGKP